MHNLLRLPRNVMAGQQPKNHLPVSSQQSICANIGDFLNMKIICIQSTTYDYLTATLIEGLQELGHIIIASENSNYAKKSGDRVIKKEAESADIIIVFSNTNVRTQLVENINNPNKVFVDGSDPQPFCVPSGILFKAVFKRELNRCWVNKMHEPIFPLPFAAEKRFFLGKSNARDIDLSYVAGLGSNTVRYSAYYRLLNKSRPRFYVGPTDESAYRHTRIHGGPTETPVFRDILFRSKISVNVIGGGYDCARYWEILASGAMLLTQELEIQIPNPFTDGLNCFTFNSMDDLDEKVEMLLSNQLLIKEIAEAGYLHLLNHHTTKARAQYFLDSFFSVAKDQYCTSFFEPKRATRLRGLIRYLR